jgi:hypothetical protein
MPSFVASAVSLGLGITKRCWRMHTRRQPMALIAERAAELGARHVLTFVDEGNVASLKGCQRAGFHPHMLHHRLQVGFGLIRHDEFESLAADDPRRHMSF